MKNLQSLLLVLLFFSVYPSYTVVPVSADNTDNTFLRFGAYVGGSGHESPSDIVLDGESNYYITGETTSDDFPLLNAFQEHNAGSYDAYIYKSSSDGLHYWSSYLGGSGYDYASGIVVDKEDNVYVAGSTSSDDFPTLNASQPNLSGSYFDGFVTSFNSNGDIRWSTYIGGLHEDRLSDIAIDESGNLYLVGYTLSTSFPTLNAYQSALNGYKDIFVTSLSPNGSLRWSTFFGGEGWDEGFHIAVDHNSNVYILGLTYNVHYPTLNAYQTEYKGDRDAVVTSFDSSGALRWSTYFGAEADDHVYGIAVDGNNNVIICGKTYSTDFPLLNAHQSEISNEIPDGNPYDTDAYVSSFSSDGSLKWSTYLGGSGSDQARGINVDHDNNVYVTGRVSSIDFPMLNSYFNELNDLNGDSFVTSFNLDGVMRWSTYLGGWSYDFASAILVNEEYQTYVAGYTVSTNFPTRSIHENLYQGEGDSFVSVLHDPLTDIDGDGMLFYYEYRNGLDPRHDDASEDADHDGLSNLEEFHLGTMAGNEDSDGDGDLDGYEVENGFDPLDPDSNSKSRLLLIIGVAVLVVISVLVVKRKIYNTATKM